MVSLKVKKRLTYFTLGSYFLMGGIEYAVILPSVWLYIHTRFDAPTYFMGIMLSAYSFSGIFAGPIFGRWADKSRKVRLILMLVSVFEMVGSFMYFMGISKWFLVGSRLVAGIGVGGESVIIAEISRFTSEAERTSVISIFIAIRQVGLLLGPGLNFFLMLANFDLGPFHVDKFTSPGLFMTLMWFIMEILLLTFFMEPEHLFTKLQVMDSVKTAYDPTQHDNDEHYTEVAAMPVVTYDDTYPEDNITATDVHTEIPKPLPIQGRRSEAYRTEILHSVTNGSVTSVTVGSVGSQSISSVGNSSALMESAERFIQSDSSVSSDRSKRSGHRTRVKRKLKVASPVERSVNSSESETFPSVSPTEKNKDAFSKGKLRFFYDEYIREEIVVILGLQFITIFAQLSLETLVTPLSDKLLHWNEFENSLLFCGAGLEIIMMFFVTSWLSRRVQDRSLILTGGIILTISTAWLTYFVPTCTVDTPQRTIAGLVAGVVLDMAALPFLFVCAVSLYSKLVSKENQGLSQGVRRAAVGMGTILAPLWGGSTLHMPYLLFGVVLGVLVLSLVLFMMSFSKLKINKEKPTSTSPRSHASSPTSNSSAYDSESQPLLA